MKGRIFTASVTVATVLASLASIFTQCISWVGEVGTAIVGDPLLTIAVGLPIALTGVGVFKRLFRI